MKNDVKELMYFFSVVSEVRGFKEWAGLSAKVMHWDGHDSI